mmetsp:Transcript_25141/g.51136  ORF Transcript_25141/g.51136 Transcript_25141/m.51136 type:complete len:116 (+) Transcript_25141:150-497(+)
MERGQGLWVEEIEQLGPKGVKGAGAGEGEGSCDGTGRGTEKFGSIQIQQTIVRRFKSVWGGGIELLEADGAEGEREDSITEFVLIYLHYARKQTYLIYATRKSNLPKLRTQANLT